MEIQQIFKKLRASTFSNRENRGFVCIPIEAWIKFEKLIKEFE